MSADDNKAKDKKKRLTLAQMNSALKKRLSLAEIELRLYREVGDLLSQGMGKGAVLSRMMDLALIAVDSEAGTFFLYDPHNNELTFEVVKGPISQKLMGMKMRADYGIVGKVAKTGRPYCCADAKNDPHWLGLASEQTQKNIIAIPLKVKRKVLGVLEIMDKRGKIPFSSEDLKVLKSLANHFSIVMERAELFGELDSRLHQLSALQGMGNLLVSSLDQKLVQRRSIEVITRLMNAEAGSLLMVDEDANELYFEVALGDRGESVKEVRLNMGQGIAGWVAKKRKPVLINDVTKDRRFMGSVDKKSNFKTRNMLCAPVMVKGRVIGVIQAINKVKGGFTKDDLQLFELLANQVAIALDNSRLYAEIKEAFHTTAGALAEAIEKRDPYTGGHTKRVLGYSVATGKYLGLSPGEQEILRLSAVLHDIGKIGIEDSILRKNAPLDATEAGIMRKHTVLGAEILKQVRHLKDVIPGMLYHHERPDGKGYPAGFRDAKIPLLAKIISVADTYDAMTTTRPYRKGLSAQVAIDEIKKYSGTQFDKRVVEAFLKAYEKNEIQEFHGVI